MVEALASVPQLRWVVLSAPMLGLVLAVAVRRGRTPARLGPRWAALTALLLCLGVTTYPVTAPTGSLPGATAPGATLGRCAVELLTGSVTVGPSALRDPEVALNVALFAVVTLAWTLAVRRPMAVALTAVALSASIELVQPFLGHSCTGQDLAANTLGAAVGAAGGALLLWVRTRAVPPS